MENSTLTLKIWSLRSNGVKTSFRARITLIMAHKWWGTNSKYSFKNFNRSKTALEFGWNMLWNRFIYFIFNFYLFIILLLCRRISRTRSSSSFNSSRYPPQFFRKFNISLNPTRIKGRLLRSQRPRNHNILSILDLVSFILFAGWKVGV